jgi:hypothetical protein
MGTKFDQIYTNGHNNANCTKAPKIDTRIRRDVFGFTVGPGLFWDVGKVPLGAGVDAISSTNDSSPVSVAVMGCKLEFTPEQILSPSRMSQSSPSMTVSDALVCEKVKNMWSVPSTKVAGESCLVTKFQCFFFRF